MSPSFKNTQFNLGPTCLLIIYTLKSASADLAPEYYQAAEPMGMGNAYTAIVEDEHAVFYNPAGVAACDDLTLHLLSVEAMASKDTVDSIDAIKTLNSPSGQDLVQFLGKNIAGQTRATSTLQMPYFSLAGFYDAQAGFYAANAALPKVELGLIRMGGVQAAFGFSLEEIKRGRGRGKKNQKISQSEWRFGVAGKFLNRRGGFREISAAQLITLDKDAVMDLFGGNSTGFGADIGTQRVQRFSESTDGYFGAVYQNIGDIQFKNGTDPVLGALNAGVGLKQRFGPFSVLGSYEMRQLNRDADFRKRQHAGAQVNFRILRFYGGMNQGYLTYGAAVDLGFLRVSGTSFGQESGTLAGQNPDRRYQVRIDLKLPL